MIPPHHRYRPAGHRDPLHDCLRCVFTTTQIKQRVEQLATDLNHHYYGMDLHAVVLMDGAIPFATDLLRHLIIPVRIHYFKISSYTGTTSDRIDFDPARLSAISSAITGKPVLVVEDILDTGQTLDFVEQVLRPHARRYGEAVLLDKGKTAEVTESPRWVGFSCPDEFVVGYGLDYDGAYRHLPGIHVLKPEMIGQS